MTVNNSIMFIQKDNVGNLCHQTNSHGLRKTAMHVYSYHFSSVLVIVYVLSDINKQIN
jgi:hypothetical protein